MTQLETCQSRHPAHPPWRRRFTLQLEIAVRRNQIVLRITVGFAHRRQLIASSVGGRCHAHKIRRHLAIGRISPWTNDFCGLDRSCRIRPYKAALGILLESTACPVLFAQRYGMCESCIEIDRRIEKHRKSLRRVTDPAEIERINRLILQRYADRVRLHRNLVN